MPPMTEIISLASVRAAALKAYREGMLTAQDPDPAQRLCVNIHKGTGRRCPIGWALSEELASFAPAKSFSYLNAVGYVKVNEPWTEIQAISAIQVAHDKWAKAMPQLRGKAEARFLRLIDPEASVHPRAAWPEPEKPTSPTA